MRSGNLSRRFLVRSILVLSVALLCYARLGDATNLEFYQDVEPGRTMDVVNNYEEIGRRLLLEAEKVGERAAIESNNGNGDRRPSMNRDGDSSPKLPWEYANYLKLYRRQKEKEMLEALLDNPSLLDDALETTRDRTKERSSSSEGVVDGAFPYSPLQRYETPENRYEDIVDETVQSRRPYYTASERFREYGSPGFPGYAANVFRNEHKQRYPEHPRSSGLPRPHERLMNRPSNDEDENFSLLGYPEQSERIAEPGLLAMRLEEQLARMNTEPRELPENDPGRVALEHQRRVPEFTYRFDEPTSHEDAPFAVKPDDPRYYETPRRESPIERLPAYDDEKTTTSLDRRESTSTRDTLDTGDRDVDPSGDYYDDENVEPSDKFSIMKIRLPEAHRRSEHGSGLVSSSPVMNNDIYFIAIVAGCSAAAMFALVLISLTWCRLQRGAKAAADIEYPAYGVTGPNKDVSPSGDQRLAHSAQMYHFQHQKQQIIAMENRTASSRDPGSVSEAESDEENEEGDYTVYECPGLASAGEMEVKNPMFHDDPISATSPQIIHNKEEDHI